MSRLLGGLLDLGGRGPDPATAAALGLLGTRLRREGPLTVAYAGSPLPEVGPICLFDGQLDNAGELRAELGRGAGNSVEDLLLACRRRWGTAFLAQLRGDFVLLVWDPVHGEGLLARDPLGARCLYLQGDPRTGLRFADEVATLLRLLPARPAPDAASLAHWLVGSTRPAEATLYSGVTRLPAGAALVISPGGARVEHFWELRYEGVLDLPEDELAAIVGEELERSVRRRAEGRIAAVLMSGGIDSAAIAAVASRRAELPLLACSGTFPDHPEADEATLTENLETALGLDRIVARARPGGILAGALAYLGQWQVPQLGWGDFWVSELLAAAAAQGAETVLDGNGGDEIFGPRSFVLADRLRGGRPLAALRLAGRLPGAGPWVPRREVAAMYGRLAVAGALPATTVDFWRGRWTGREAPAWLAPATRRALVDTDDPGAWKRLDGPRWWAHAAGDVFGKIVRGGFAEHQRHRAAAHGLEARHPMLDLDLIALTLRLPPEASLDPRFNRPVLRAALSGLLPDEIRLRAAKAWFQTLIADALGGADGAAVRALLTGPDSELGAYLDVEAMSRALFADDAARRREPHRWVSQVWRLLGAECWLRSQSRPVGAILPPGTSASEANVEIEPRLRSDLFQP